MDKLKMCNLNGVDKIIDAISALFPQAITEVVRDGKVQRVIDFDVLKQELSGNIVEKEEEHYQFTWPNKRKAALSANVPSTSTLRPIITESVGKNGTPAVFDSENLYIEGDNLEVLKLLRKSYGGKVKMIYIDPPYNTNKEFVYIDNNENSIRNNKKLTDQEGKYIDGAEISERYHTDWLNMMYPRLKLARDLLTEYGYICISIDDREFHNIREICNEIFGEENFASNFVIIRSEGGGLAKHAVIGHDYLLAYAKNIKKSLPLGKRKDIRGQIVLKEGEEYWIETDWLRKEFGKYGVCHYEDIIKYYNEDKKNEIDIGIKEGRYILIPKEGKHIVGRFRKVSEDTSKFYTVVKHLNKNGVEDLKKLDLDSVFDYPKPVSLVKEFVLGATIHSKEKSDLILDFFSGSSTSAHAVMCLNAEDGGNRRFIMVQLPEPCDNYRENNKVGYKNVCEIGKERIRRVGQKIKAEYPDSDIDIGFRCLRLES